MKSLQGVSLTSTFVICLACGGGPKPSVSQEQSAGTQIAAPQATTPVVARKSPDELTALLDEAMEAVNNGDLTSAEEQYQDVVLQAVAEDEATGKIVAEARYNLGVIAEWQGAYDDAKRHYEAALTLKADLGAAVVAIGRIILRTQDVASALNYAKGRLSARPESLPLRNALNRIRVAADREWDSVESDSKEILRVEEKNVDAMVNLAISYHSGRHELAISVLNGAKAIDGSDPEIYLRMALSNLALDEKLNARLVLEEAVSLPQGASAEVYNNLGVIYHVAGDFSGLKYSFERRSLDGLTWWVLTSSCECPQGPAALPRSTNIPW